MKRLRSNSILVLFCIWIFPVSGQMSLSEAADVRESRFARFVQAQEVAVMSAEAGGLIVGMPFGPQDFVKEGEVLVQLDPNLIALELDKIRSQIALSTKEKAAAVQLQYAKDTYEITERLYKTIIVGDPNTRVGTEKEYKEAKQNMELMELRVRDARLEMKLLEVQLAQMGKRLSQMSIRAPWDGVIVPFYSVKNVPQLETLKPPTVGEMVTTGQAVVAMMKVDILKVQSEITKLEQLDSLYLGKSAKVYIPFESKEAIPAKVVFISPTVDSTGVVPFEVEFENPENPASGKRPGRGFYRYRFRPGMKVKVELE